MKLIIRLSFLLITAFAFTGCSKVIFDDNYQDSIAGSWVLTDAAHKDAYGWYSVNTGVERGVFTFFNNGDARYEEAGVTMYGTWQVYYNNGGYYDEYGNYYSDRHQSLQVNLNDGYGDESINMYFENVRINSNSFVGTNYHKDYIERYRFSRY
jgi:hypothetical protein